MTLEEKIEVIRAYDEGKEVEVYTPYIAYWKPLKDDIWNFEIYQYRIKPKRTFKFKVNDNLVYRGDAAKPSPTIYTVMHVDDTGYTLNNGEFEKSPEIIEKEFINVRDALWYFEIYDHVTKKYYMGSTRMTMAKMDEEFGANHYTLSWQPMYSLGFKLKGN